MVDYLLIQVCHKKSSLANKTSKKWTVYLLRFKAEVNVLIQGLGVTDAPKAKHIIYRAAVCRFFYIKINQAAVNEDPTLLTTRLNSDWRKLTDWCINGTVIKPDMIVSILQLAGYRCEDISCGALASNNQLCSSCKLQTATSGKLFPSSKPSTFDSKNANYKRDRLAAKVAFVASPEGAAFRLLDINDTSVHKAFVSAFPTWASATAHDQKESTYTTKTYDAATCHDYLLKHQAEFDLPVGLRST
jgi:hypothetical protein